MATSHIVTIWIQVPAARRFWTDPDEGKVWQTGQRVLAAIAGGTRLPEGTSLRVGSVEIGFELRVGNDADERGNLVLYLESADTDLTPWTAIVMRTLRLLTSEGLAFQFMVNDGEKSDSDRLAFTEFAQFELL